MGDYVLREACTQVRAWRDAGFEDLWVSVNLSARQLHNQGLLDTLQEILVETDLPGDALQLELTESVLLKDLDRSESVFKELARLGVAVSLDDFGNGYSSLGHLNRFPLKVLKIDQTFIRDLAAWPTNEAIITAIVSMAHTLKLEVVAEGVETAGQLAFLQSAGCDDAQGFLLSPPLPADEVTGLLEKGTI
jgi:EAL domain-containing protein (putative c-di-GMP-specific phosphodiesterase class I)